MFLLAVHAVWRERVSKTVQITANFPIFRGLKPGKIRRFYRYISALGRDPSEKYQGTPSDPSVIFPGVSAIRYCRTGSPRPEIPLGCHGPTAESYGISAPQAGPNEWRQTPLRCDEECARDHLLGDPAFLRRGELRAVRHCCLRAVFPADPETHRHQVEPRFASFGCEVQQNVTYRL